MYQLQVCPKGIQLRKHPMEETHTARYVERAQSFYALPGCVSIQNLYVLTTLEALPPVI